MRIKSFYANTVEGALCQAHREMGAEAMLVESRKAPLEARHLGEYEVVCALVPEAESAPPQASEEAVPQDDRLAREMAEMRRQLDVMGKTITRSAWSGARWPSASPEMPEWHARLMATDMDAELVDQILEAAERRAGPGSSGLEGAIMAEIAQRILVSDRRLPGNGVPASGHGPRAVALVGPPGAGKTTMLAKLAVTWGLSERRALALVSMDDFRVAGADQLRSYAAILGFGFQALDSVGALAQALDEHQGKRLVLIDTPGYGPHDMDRAADLARFLSTRTDVATHLVLTASMKSADLTRVAQRFEIFRPSTLLFSRVDETACFGTAFSLSVRQAKPISFLGTGQEIPDDAAPATKERILSLLWPETLAKRLAA